MTCGCSRTRSCTRLVFSLLWLYYAKYELAYPVFPGLHPLVPVRYKRMKPYNFFLEREDRIVPTTPSGVRIVSTRMQVHILCSVNFYFVLIIQFFDQVSGGKSMCFKLETSDNSHQYLVAIRSARTLTHPRVLHTHCPALSRHACAPNTLSIFYFQ